MRTCERHLFFLQKTTELSYWLDKISFRTAPPTVICCLHPRSNPSIKIGIDLSLHKSIKIGKSDLIDIDCIDQSVEIDDTLVSFIDLSRLFFYLYRKIHLSALLFIQKWKPLSCKQWICWQLSSNWELKDQTILVLKKKKTWKKSFLFFKTRFKVFFWWPILARFLGAQFFHDLDLPPFQNNISSTCSYFPE